LNAVRPAWYDARGGIAMAATHARQIDPGAHELAELYEQDETAWLETMSQLIARRRFAELDCDHLSEYLSDMAKRDRREVYSRLVVLMSHLLKWEHQPDRRTGSWRGTMREQRRELRQLLESGTLRNHADTVLPDAYIDARLQAADETEVPVDALPATAPWSVDQVVYEDLPA
jgi:hypothetical protein